MPRRVSSKYQVYKVGREKGKEDMNTERKMGRKKTGEGRNVRRKAINKIIEL